MADPISWLLGAIWKWAGQRVYDKLTKSHLIDHLRTEVREWARELPDDKHVEPAAIFDKVPDDADPKEWPALAALGQHFAASRVPTEQAWLDALLEQWRKVRETVDHPQPFFSLDPSEAKENLSRLARRLALQCQQDDEMFRPAVIEKLDFIASHLQSGGSGLTRLFQLPAPVADFTGRQDEVRTIVDRLREDGGKAGLPILLGMGGVGKTSMAVKVAHEVKDQFSDAQLLVELQGTADRPVTAAEAMARVIHDFHPDAQLPDAESELLPLYRSALAGKRVLILLDNAKDEAQVRPLVTAPSPVRFLVTSRNALDLDGAELIRLDVLPPGEALTLLRGIAGEKGTDDELRTVAELCGRLPLALRVAGSFLHLHANWPVSRYIEALGDENTRLGRLKGKTAERDVEAVLALSASQLVLENEGLAERWQVLAVFPADFIELAAMSVWNLEKGDAIKAEDELTALLDRSLIQFNEKARRYSLHDLMRPVARKAFGYVEGHRLSAGTADRIREAERRFAVHYKDLLAVADRVYLQGHEKMLAGLSIYDWEEANIAAGWGWAAANRESDRLATELCRDYPNLGVFVLGLRQPVWTRILWNETAVAACRALADRPGECNALGNLGIAFMNSGDAHRAITCHEQALAIAREFGNRRAERQALVNLGNAYLILGDSRKAKTRIEQSLAIAREIEDQWGELNALANLGIAYKNLGDAKKAIELFQQALVVTRNLGDLRREGYTLGNLATAHLLLGDARQGRSFLEEQLAISRKIGDRFGEATVLGNLGIIHKERGEYEAAIGFHEQHLAIAREIGDRPGEARALGNLGLAYLETGHLDLGIELTQASLDIDRDIGDRRGQASALGNLGIAHALRGDFRGAIEFYRQQLAIAEEIGDRRGEAHAHANMASALQELGQREEAIQHLERALALFEATGHPGTERLRRELAELRGRGE